MSDELWFRFHPSKFMAGIRGLNANEVKAYISLLCRMYERGGPIPNDAEVLSTYCEMRPSSFEKALARLIRLGKIKEAEGGIFNDTAEREISQRASKSEIAKRAGQKSAEKRQEKQQPQANGRSTGVQLEEKRREENKKPPKPPLGAGFEDFWEAFNYKVGRKDAERAYAKALRVASAETILAGAKRYAATRKPDFIAHPSTWLNGERWNDAVIQAVPAKRKGVLW